MGSNKIHIVFFFFSLVYSSFLLGFCQKEIVVVVPSYNNKDWYQRNLSSILEQDYSNFTVIYIDDSSQDGTGVLVEEFLVQHDHHHRVTVIKNDEQQGALANHWKAVQMIPDHAIVVHLDGDDWFAHSNVLQRVNQEYQDEEVWMTYGQFINHPSGEIGHCQLTPPDVMATNSWRDSLLMRWSHLRTFYAWLFKQIKFDDLIIKNQFFPIACDNAFMYPMLEMAQHHVCFIPDVLYVYNHETPLNDYKLRLQLHLATAYYIKNKKHYNLLESKPEKLSPKDNVSLVVFSFNRPLQLYAFLESVYYYCSNIGAINILYRTSNKEFENAYQDLKNSFPKVTFIKQNSLMPHATFKKEVLELITTATQDFILFGVDDIVITDFINFSQCIDLMEKTHAYGFFLRLGKNITNNYLLDVSLNYDDSIPNYIEIESSIYAWQFKYAKKDWAYPNTLDMTLYRKKDIQKTLETLSFTTPNTLEGQWYGSSDFSNIGLCFEESKVVNIPLNIVQEAQYNRMIFNKTTYNLDIHELLKTFNEKKKIDIMPLHCIVHSAPHIDYLPNFIMR